MIRAAEAGDAVSVPGILDPSKLWIVSTESHHLLGLLLSLARHDRTGL